MGEARQPAKKKEPAWPDIATEGGDYILTVTNDDNGCTLNDTTNVQNICGPARKITTKAATDSSAAGISNVFEFKAYPNPFNKQAFVVFKSPRSAFVTVQLFNSNGMLEKNLYNDKAAAGQLYQLPFTGWFVPGVHYVVVRVDNTIYTRQLVSVQ